MSKIQDYLVRSLDEVINTFESTGALPTKEVEGLYKDYLSLVRGRESKYMYFMAENYYKPKGYDLL